MDTWTDKKIFKDKIPKQKWEKLACTHKKDNFTINHSWVYSLLDIDGFMEENSHAHLSQKWIFFPLKQKVPPKFVILPSPSCKTWKNFLASYKKKKKKIGGGRIYHGKQGYQYRLPESC